MTSHQTAILYTPMQAQEQLAVSNSTLRRWCAQFENHLSEATRGRPRRYSDDDIAVLLRVKALFGEGYGVEDVERLLAIEPPDDAQAGATAATEQPRSATEPLQGDSMALAMFDSLATSQDRIAQALEHLASRQEQAQDTDRLADALDKLAGQQAPDLSSLARHSDLLALLERLEALERSVDALAQQVADLAGQMGSVGQHMHTHTGIGRVGMREPGQ